MTNFKTWNSMNLRFFTFLRLPLSIQKYSIAYYIIYLNCTFAIHGNCAYLTQGIKIKNSLNETILVLLQNMRLPCWKLRNLSASTKWYRKLELRSYYCNKSYSWRNGTHKIWENLVTFYFIYYGCLNVSHLQVAPKILSHQAGEEGLYWKTKEQ